MRTRSYSPDQIKVSFDGVPFQAPGKGSFCKVSRMTDAVSSDVGAGGDVVRVKSRDKRGQLTYTFSRTSPTLLYLSTIAVADEADDAPPNAGVKSLFVKDLNSTILAGGDAAWIVKIPDLEFAVENTDIEVTFHIASMDYFVGGLIL